MRHASQPKPPRVDIFLAAKDVVYHRNSDTPPLTSTQPKNIQLHSLFVVEAIPLRGTPKTVGATECKSNTGSPTFHRPIRVSFEFQETQRYRVHAYIHTRPFTSSSLGDAQPVGTVDFQLSVLMSMPNTTLILPIERGNDNGKVQSRLYIHGVEVLSDRMSFRFQISALNVKPTRWLQKDSIQLQILRPPSNMSPLRATGGAPPRNDGIPSPVEAKDQQPTTSSHTHAHTQKTPSKAVPLVDYVVVYKSTTALSQRSPEYPEFSIPIQALTGNSRSLEDNYDSPIIIRLVSVRHKKKGTDGAAASSGKRETNQKEKDAGLPQRGISEQPIDSQDIGYVLTTIRELLLHDDFDGVYTRYQKSFPRRRHPLEIPLVDPTIPPLDLSNTIGGGKDGGGLKSTTPSTSLAPAAAAVKAQKGSKKSIGTICIQQCYLQITPSFVDYLQNLSLRMFIAIDFTASNTASHLHKITSTSLNQYEQSILSIGNILMSYCDNTAVYATGYGGDVSIDGGQQTTNHCFPLTLSTGHYFVEFDDLLNVYRWAMRLITPSGPTYFRKIVEQVAEIASQPFTAESHHYSVLLILTDGIVNDMAETVEAIVNASQLPLSIIIVGIGNADFTSMALLDSDDGPLTTASGTAAARDIVQFIPFREMGMYDRRDLSQQHSSLQHRHQHSQQGYQGPNLEAIARATLGEIPQQILSFYQLHNISPASAAGKLGPQLYSRQPTPEHGARSHLP